MVAPISARRSAVTLLLVDLKEYLVGVDGVALGIGRLEPDGVVIDRARLRASSSHMSVADEHRGDAAEISVSGDTSRPLGVDDALIHRK